MKKLLLWLIPTIACVSHIYAEEYFAEDCCYPEQCSLSRFYNELSFSWNLGAGYRSDNLKWAFPGFSPGVAIHQKWDNIEFGFIESNSRIYYRDFILKSHNDFGWSGKERKHRARLIDYNSATENNHLPKNKTEGEVYDSSMGIGKQIRFDCLQSMFTPLIGWAYNFQRFRNPSFYGPKRHRSDYTWSGPWIGFEASFNPCEPLFVYIDYAYHDFGHFRAKVKEFFRHRLHRNKFRGNEVEFGTTYQWCNDWYAGFKVNYKNYFTQAKHSVDESADGSGHPQRTRWNSVSVSLNVGLDF